MSHDQLFYGKWKKNSPFFRQMVKLLVRFTLRLNQIKSFTANEVRDSNNLEFHILLFPAKQTEPFYPPHSNQSCNKRFVTIECK